MTSDGRWDEEVDVAIVGASAGGLVAARVVAEAGLEVAVFEKTDYIGGAATMGPVVWGPCTSVLAEKGIPDRREDALRYLELAAQGRGDRVMAAAYVDTVGEVLDFLQERTPLRFVIWRGHGEYYSLLHGAKDEGRLLVPHPAPATEWLVPLEQRHPELALVRATPHVDFDVDMERFADGRPLRQAWMGGRALVGALLVLVLESGVSVRLGAPATSLIEDGDEVIGVELTTSTASRRVRARRGVLLSAGGFEWSDEMRRRHLPIPGLVPQTPPANTGDGVRMGVDVGAATALMDQAMVDPCFRLEGESFEGAPVYRLANAYAGKPHAIVVNRAGRRFASEAAHYQLEAAWASVDPHTRGHSNLPSFLVFDQDFRDRYGVPGLDAGASPPEGLASAPTPHALAIRLGIDAAGLVGQLERYNAHAVDGEDPEFHRGSTQYERSFGDPGHPLNPNIGAVSRAPFYGFQLHPASGGTRGGLVTTARAEVVNMRGEPIPGLYASGNTAAQLMIGAGYTSGISLGSSLVFAYAAARRLVAVSPR